MTLVILLAVVSVLLSIYYLTVVGLNQRIKHRLVGHWTLTTENKINNLVLNLDKTFCKFYGPGQSSITQSGPITTIQVVCAITQQGVWRYNKRSKSVILSVDSHKPQELSIITVKPSDHTFLKENDNIWKKI